MGRFDATGDEVAWGSDGLISMPHVKESLESVEVDVGGGFVFTPMGLRFDMNEADRSALLAQSYRPREVPHG